MRTEYPRPQQKRQEYLILNGEWDFKFLSGDETQLFNQNYDYKIIVPFAYQSELSGINTKEKHEYMLYKKEFTLGKEYSKKGAILCFNGVDYECEIYVNRKLVGTHKGAYGHFDFDITNFIKLGKNELVIKVIDKNDPKQVRGKQCWDEPFGCWYYQTSGIFQSVWLDFYEKNYIENLYITPNLDDLSVKFDIRLAKILGTDIEIEIFKDNKSLQKVSKKISKKDEIILLKVSDENMIDKSCYWTPENPTLFDIKVSVKDNNKILDEIFTYTGFRKISIDESGTILLNNRPYYQKLVLDQGYFDKGGLTAPSHEVIKNDIALMKKLGFNGARKHQKIEDPYFYYYADKLGFLTYLECPSAYEFDNFEIRNQMNEWMEIVHNNYNFVSIICYVPLNESWGVRDILYNSEMQNYAKSLYYITKSLDPTRLVSTNDGWENVFPSDIATIHDYIKDGEEIINKYSSYDIEKIYPQGRKQVAFNNKYNNEPVLFSEFGGIALVSDLDKNDWGYNKAASNGEELKARIKDMVSAIHKTSFQGYCYTQFTDVEQEKNGICTISRDLKVNLEENEILFF